jgi:hypothetical protein
MEVASAVLLLTVGWALGPFMPNVRVDHQNLPDHHVYSGAVALGLGASANQPVYVVFQDDSFAGLNPMRMDVVFQKTTDAGATWLSEDRIVRRGETYAQHPDVTTDRDGNIYIAYTECPVQYDGHIYCVRSTDGGATWTTPATVDDNDPAVRVGSSCLATDAVSNLFCIWTDYRTGESHIWSSVSTDRGTSWSLSVRVCDDTVYGGCGGRDVYVQPGTNHYLVAATAGYRVRPGYKSRHACLYRSTDMGQTFQPGIQLDTFEFASATHVVADSQHIICDYTGRSEGEYNQTQARTLYTPPDTWGPRSTVNDTDYNSYYSGELAISPDGRVHIALMMNWLNGYYDMCYAFSTDYGASWSSHVRMNDDTTSNKQYPKIAVDSAGHVYAVWDGQRGGGDHIWFSTNTSIGVAESRVPQTPGAELRAAPSIFRQGTAIRLPVSAYRARYSPWSVRDASGRLVRSIALPPSAGSVIWNGRDDVGCYCAPGVYVVCAGNAVEKVVLLPAE